VVLSYVGTNGRTRQTSSVFSSWIASVWCWRIYNEDHVAAPANHPHHPNQHTTLPYRRPHTGLYLGLGILQPRFVTRKQGMKPTYDEQLGLSGIAANNLLRRKHKGVMFSIPPCLQFSHTRRTFITELNEVSITMRQVEQFRSIHSLALTCTSYYTQHSLHERRTGSIAVFVYWSFGTAVPKLQ